MYPMRGCGLLAAALALAIAGCAASTKNPERLFAVTDEMDAIKSSQKDFIEQYSEAIHANSLTRARAIRNEIIAERMYAIDVQYSQYEAALTQETQEIGFATLTTAEGLSTAATLVTPIVTKSILSGLTTAVVATKGHYDSEVLLALTMRTIQKQMRASRNQFAEQINRRMAQDVTDYPLSAALSDIEDYYRAGTLTSGVIDTSTTVGAEEKKTEERKQAITRLKLDARRTAVLPNTTTPIPPPVQFGVLNPDGIGDFERRSLVPARVAEFQTVLGLCSQPPVFTPELRDAVLEYLSSQKDPTLPKGITVRDAQKMRNEFRAIRDGRKPNPCKKS